MVLNTVFKIAAVLVLTLISMDQAAAIPMASKAQLTGDRVEQKDCDTKGVRSQSTLGMLGGLIQKVNLHSPTGQDPLEKISRTGEFQALAAIGTIMPNQAINVKDAKGNTFNTKNYRGTATLISPCYAFTAYHVAFGISKDPSKLSKKLTQSLQFVSNGKVVTEKNASVAAFGQYHKTGNLADDWALIRLPSCPGTQIEPLQIDDSINAKTFASSDLLIAGYPTDRSSDTLWAHKDCSAKDDDTLNPGTRQSFCASIAGLSGAPLMKKIGGRYKMVAMNVGDYNYSPGVKTEKSTSNANIAIDMRSMRYEVAKFTKPDFDQAKGLNPKAPGTIIVGQK